MKPADVVDLEQEDRKDRLDECQVHYYAHRMHLQLLCIEDKSAEESRHNRTRALECKEPRRIDVSVRQLVPGTVGADILAELLPTLDVIKRSSALGWHIIQVN